jgi:hypothetical protein
VNVAAPVQTRLLVVLGLVAAAVLAFVLFRGNLPGGDEPTASTAPVVRTPAAKHATTRPSPATPNAAKPRKPVVVLNPGLPTNLARALRREKVVVAAVFAAGAGDLGAVAEARTGAHKVGAGFVTLNVLEERKARALQKLAGPLSAPSVLVFKRPGKIALRFDGFADSAVVAQAAHNAGAR